jgi:hypothetical protein
MTGDVVAAMRLTEEIFKKMFESVSKLNDHMAFEQWFYSIALNICKPCAATVYAETGQTDGKAPYLCETARCIQEEITLYLEEHTNGS